MLSRRQQHVVEKAIYPNEVSAVLAASAVVLHARACRPQQPGSGNLRVVLSSFTNRQQFDK
jgi:hypothetical protein